MKISQGRTFAAALIYSILIATFVMFIMAVVFFDARFMLTFGVTFVTVFVTMLFLNYRVSSAWSKLPQSRMSFAKKHKYEYLPRAGHIDHLKRIALTRIDGSRDEAFYNHITTGNWQYCDFSFNYYKKTKYGEYHAGTVYYGVMFAKLTRALPNVFFDSKQARGRQFRFVFARKQKHSLEGDFDKYFTTYFPEQYTIDSMSFISPDVMQELKNASEYDIEIVGDLVCLYGPVPTNEQDILTMAVKMQKIKNQLMDNITTYRDERLPFSVGRKQVAVQGMTLGRSKFFARLSIAALILYLAFHIISLLMNMAN